MKFRYDRKGPWPQPNPHRPMGEAPIVLNVPFRERLDFLFRVGLRIGLQSWIGIPLALWKALRQRPKTYISNARFDHIMTTSAYEKFLTAEFSEAEQRIFARYLPDENRPEVIFYKSVFTAIKGVKPYPDMYVTPTTSLIREEAGRREVVAVQIGDLIVDRTHTNAWNTTKFFVLQGAAYSMLFTEHPNLHFPYDSINAITQSSVPIGHPVLQLLLPHLRFQLQLNKLVLTSKLSVITNWRPTFYAPFTAKLTDGLLDFFVAGYHGVEGESAYPKYSFRAEPKSVHGDYGIFLQSYYQTVLDFTRKVANTIAPGDEYTKRWATYIHRWVPGFPSGTEIFEGETLAKVLAGIVWNNSVGHDVDHQAFTHDVSTDEKYLRLRIPPPTSIEEEASDPTKVNNWWDRFKAHLASRVFFEPNIVTKLVDVKYNFEESHLNQAGREFIEALEQTERDLSVPHYIPLKKVSASIQF